MTKTSRKISLRKGATAIAARMIASSLKFRAGLWQGRLSLLASQMLPSRIRTARYYGTCIKNIIISWSCWDDKLSSLSSNLIIS